MRTEDSKCGAAGYKFDQDHNVCVVSILCLPAKHCKNKNKQITKSHNQHARVNTYRGHSEHLNDLNHACQYMVFCENLTRFSSGRACRRTELICNLNHCLKFFFQNIQRTTERVLEIKRDPRVLTI